MKFHISKVISHLQIALISELDTQKLNELNVKIQNDTFKLVFREMDTNYT